MELLTVVVTAIISSIAGPILVKEFVHWREKRRKKDPLMEAIKENSLVSAKLEQIKQFSGSDRIWLAQFHNGGYFYPSGKSIQKFSIIYQLGSESIIQKYQNIPISLFTRGLDKLQKGSIIEIPDIDNTELYNSAFIMMDENSKSIYVFPLMTIDNKFVGFVVIDFHKERILSEGEISNIKVDVTTIAGVLINKLIQ